MDIRFDSKKGEIMSKDSTKSASNHPSNYSYNMSNYVVLNSTVRRDASSGRFVETLKPKRSK
jgi:hypothetical protein